MHITFVVGNMDQKKVRLKPLMPNFYTKLQQILLHDSEKLTIFSKYCWFPGK
jgi:hypothetical protein